MCSSSVEETPLGRTGSMSTGSQHPEILVRRIDDFLVSTGVKGVGAATIGEAGRCGARHLIAITDGSGGEEDRKRNRTGAGAFADRELDTALFDGSARLDQLFKGLAPFVGLEGMGERNWGKVLPMLPSDVNALQKLNT